MNWKTTWTLVLAAAVVLGYIVTVERRNASGPDLTTKLLPLPSAAVNSIQVRRTNQLVLHAERTNANWNLTVPISYPASSLVIELLLKELDAVAGPPHITKQELDAEKRSIAEFGLDVPAATLTLQAGKQRAELYFGNKTSVGDQVFVQALNTPGIFLLSADLLHRLPQTANDWRETALISFGNLNPDRVEVRAAGRGFAIRVDPTNSLFYLSKPTPARADRIKVESLLFNVQTARVVRFVTDNIKADLEPYGLQPPEAELAFGTGTNDALVIQFGRSPTNDPALVYARRLSQTNVVLVARPVLDALLTPYSELRDRRLLAVNPSEIRSIEVVGPENFTVRRQTNDLWVIGDPPGIAADGGLLTDWMTLLGRLEGNVEKDFVTDFAGYGLARPARQFILRSATTNAAGVLTNQVVGQLDIGSRLADRVFLRRPDEASVYSVAVTDLDQLPNSSWQLRDRRVWNFTTNQVQRITVRQRGYSRTLERNPQGRWTLAAGSQGIVKSAEAIEELMFQLGKLRAVWWTAQGNVDRVLYGFTDAGYRLTVELKDGEKLNPLTLEFGGWAPSKFPWALTTLDGKPVVFEFPLQLFWLLQRDLSNPSNIKAASSGP